MPKDIWCEQCGQRIYRGDRYYVFDDVPVCSDCAEEYLDENRRYINEEGDDVYLVDDMEWYVEDIDRLLDCCEQRKDDYDTDDGDPRDEPEYWEDR